METANEREFDHEAFQHELKERTRAYASASWITYSPHTDPSVNEKRKIDERNQYHELLDFCVEALLTSDEPEKVMEMISDILAYYVHGNGFSLLGDGGRITLYQDLTLRLAIKRHTI